MSSFFFRELLRRWLLTLGCFVLLLFFFCPPWGAFKLGLRVPELGGMLEVRRGLSVLQQLAHPGAVIADPLHRVIQWRLLFPMLGHAIGLPPALLFLIAPLGVLLVLFRLVSLLRTAAPTLPATICASAVLLLGAASWFFTSTGWLGYYDSWLALALLAVAFGRSRVSVWTACLLAPWIDERFILALPLALLCRHLWLGASSPGWRDAVIPGILAGAFVLIRLVVLQSRSGAEATLGGYFAHQNYLAANPPRIALGLWEGLRGGWLFAIAGVWTLAHSSPSGRAHAIILAVATLGLAAVGLATAQDYSRSMTMLFPVAVLGLLLALRAGTFTASSRLLPFAAGLALLLPAHHVMNDRVNPIYYLYHELALLRTPPTAAMPELYELRAIHAMERGDYEVAREQLNLAIKLAANPASPAKQRGILAASQGRWADALQDFSLMVEHDAGNPDAWLMRAQARLALSQIAAAHDDFQHALSLAPPGWAQRGDVARFATKLNSAR